MSVVLTNHELLPSSPHPTITGAAPPSPANLIFPANMTGDVASCPSTIPSIFLSSRPSRILNEQQRFAFAETGIHRRWLNHGRRWKSDTQKSTSPPQRHSLFLPTETYVPSHSQLPVSRSRTLVQWSRPTAVGLAACLRRTSHGERVGSD